MHNEQWTSPHREKAGFAPFVPAGDESVPAFAIRDAGGEFAQALARAYPEVSRIWGRRPKTWYLEVKASYGGLGEEFSLTWEQFERVRDSVSQTCELLQLTINGLTGAEIILDTSGRSTKYGNRCPRACQSL